MVVLRWYLLGLANAVRAALARSRRDVCVLGGGALFLVIYNVANSYESLVRAAPIIRAMWPRVAQGGMLVALLMGGIAGRVCAHWAAQRAEAAWLAVLPWSVAARTRAARIAAVSVGGMLMPLPAFCGWGVSHAVSAPGQVWAAAMPALGFMAAFVTASWPSVRGAPDDVSPEAAGAAARRVGLVWRLVGRLDRQVPRWAGIWAQQDDARGLSRWWIGSLVVAGGAAGAVTIAQLWAVPSLTMAVVGGNLAYIFGLRGGPLLSPVLRSSQLGFGAAWQAMARGPAALSFLWFGVVSLPAVAVSEREVGQSAGCAGVLLLLNGLYSTAVALIPNAWRASVLLYAALLFVVLYQGLAYGTAYGVLAGVAMMGVAVLLWRQARRRFRAHG